MRRIGALISLLRTYHVHHLGCIAQFWRGFWENLHEIRDLAHKIDKPIPKNHVCAFMHSEWAVPRLSKRFEFRHTAIRAVADTYTYHRKQKALYKITARPLR
jgi:hypothetical protein